MKPNRWKKGLITFLKFGLSAALVGYLVIDASRGETFTDLRDQPKHWGLLAAAWALCMLAVVSCMARWYLLVRALGLPFKMRDALRLGFLGYLFNFVSLGNVGGDLFKAVFLAREQRGRRAEAVATVIADRLIGLYALLLVASGAILFSGQLNAASEIVRDVCRTTLVVTAVSTFGFAILLMPGFTSNRLRTFLYGLRRGGHLFRQVFSAIDIYRRKPGVLLSAVAISLGIHTCSCVGFYLIACGLPGSTASLSDHFLIVPLGMLTGILPLPMNGLGAIEGVLDYLYSHIPLVKPIAHQGLLVAIAYRLITIAIAMVGACFYIGHRREVADIMKKAEAEQEADNDGQVESRSAVPV